MIEGIRLKICGLTTLVDVESADHVGADYLGFILYPKSPRYLPLRQYRDMAPQLPEGRLRVAVMVEPTEDELARVRDAGFDRFQLHHRLEVPDDTLQRWREGVGRDRLWLAPKLPPTAEPSAAVLAAAGTVLYDTYSPEQFGGTGRTGDWEKFRRLQAAHPGCGWILAGGLTPNNVAVALRASGARIIDVSSGVELAPGIKDHAKLRTLAQAIRRERTGAAS